MSSAAVYTSEFQSAFEAQTQRMLRTRFIWFLATVALIYLLAALLGYGRMALLASGLIPETYFPGAQQMLSKEIAHMRGAQYGLYLVLALIALDVVVYVWCLVRVLRRPMGRERLIKFTQWFLVYRGVSGMIALFAADHLGFPWALMFYHALACGFLPWTPEQAIRPMGPLLVLNSILVLLFSDMGPSMKALTIVLSLFAAGPGVGIAYFKHSRRMERFKMQMIQARYGQMRRELVDARRIHEALFPRPISSGPLRLDYRYEPMRQIGGDYLYARFSPSHKGRLVPGKGNGIGNGTGGDGIGDAGGVFNMLLLDVTGHGIAAALTVNRLYGEVERLYAEDPYTGPDEVMCALNKYVHLTLANHSIYATALCMRFDPDQGTLEYASGGHPPAFLCTADGRIEQLDSTSFVLGACAAQDFRANVESRRFEPGDTLLAYTDGAIECRNEQGRMLGVNGLLRVLASCVGAKARSVSPAGHGHSGGAGGAAAGGSGAGGAAGLASIGLAAAVLSAVESHRSGPAEDDTLVVEVVRSATDRSKLDSGTRSYVRDSDEPALVR